MNRSALLGPRPTHWCDLLGLPIGLGLFMVGVFVAQLPRCALLSAPRPGPPLGRRS